MPEDRYVPPDTEMQLQPLLDDDLDDPDTDVMAFGSQQPALLRERRQRRRIWLAAVSGVLILALVGGGLLYMQLTKTPPVQFTQATVDTGDLSVRISATGPITANAVYNMNFSTVGQVREIDVQIGQHVTQGQVLAKINVDTTALQDAITQAQLGLTSAQTSLDAAYASLGTARVGRNNSLASNAAQLTVAQDQEQSDLTACKTDTTCQKNAQDKFAQAQTQINASNASANSQVTSAQNQVVSAQGNVDKAAAQLQAAQHSLDSANANTNLTAPVNATVAAINGSIGQNVGSGSSSSSSTSTSAFMILTDTGKLGISALVNEADIGNVQQNQPAQFTVAAYPGTPFRAAVSAIETIGQTTSNVVSYPVLLTVDQNSLNNLHLYPGMTATVNITTAQRIGALLIPNAALSFPTIALQTGEVNRSAIVSGLRGGQQGGNTTNKSRVILTLKNGKLTPVVITTGLSDGQFTEVLSGLNAGDQVVVGQTGGTTPTTTSGGGGGGRGGAGGGGGGPVRFGGGGG